MLKQTIYTLLITSMVIFVLQSFLIINTTHATRNTISGVVPKDADGTPVYHPSETVKKSGSTNSDVTTPNQQTSTPKETPINDNFGCVGDGKVFDFGYQLCSWSMLCL